jgi:hypothetical protein
MLTTCIIPFTLNELRGVEATLVIEGDIILQGDTKVYLSLSRSLDGEDVICYVTDAMVWIEGESGDQYAGLLIVEANTPPYFIIDSKALDVSKQYKLCILHNGKQFESDFLSPLKSPEIYSIDYQINDTRTTVEFFVTSYGEENASRYYKWAFREDWEITSKYATNFFFDPISNRILQYTADPHIFYCWNQSESTSIIIAKTDHLDNNTVYRQQLNIINCTSDRISHLYSMELYQMSISKEAYDYWSVLKKNTDEIGGIFSPQPCEMSGNIRCLSDANTKVLGYISAGTITSKRVFISEKDIGIYISFDCPFFNESDFNQPLEPAIPLTNREKFDMGYAVVRVELVDPIEWVPLSCVDCRIRGNKNKPPFWPNDHL